MSSTVAIATIDLAVANAIDMMRADLRCEAGIVDIARQNFYSQFHFTREFGRITGTTPRRYLAALRMDRAKSYLLNSDRGIAEIGHLVGYSSVGTFSSRFAQLVGFSPSVWRRSGGMSSPAAVRQGPGAARCIGHISLHDTVGAEYWRALSVGAYEDSIVQGAPLASTTVERPGTFRLDGLPVGSWTVVVRSDPRPAQPVNVLGRQHAHLSLAVPPEIPAPALYGFGTLQVTPHSSHFGLNLTARHLQPTDPPVVFAGHAA